MTTDPGGDSRSRRRGARPRPTPRSPGFLFNSAKNGNVSAQIFWLKTRARWRETPVELKHSGTIGRRDLSQLSDEDLLNIIGSVGAELQATEPGLVEDATSHIEDSPSLLRFPVPVR